MALNEKKYPVPLFMLLLYSLCLTNLVYTSCGVHVVIIFSFPIISGALGKGAEREIHEIGNPLQTLVMMVQTGSCAC